MPHRAVIGALALAALHHHLKGRRQSTNQGALNAAQQPRRKFDTGGQVYATPSGALPSLSSLAGNTGVGADSGLGSSLGALGRIQGMPNAQTIGEALGVSPTAISAGSLLAGTLAGPAGLAVTGLNALGNVVNTVNNTNMLGRMGDNVSLGQMLGGVLGSGLAGSPDNAMANAMGTPNGRAALSTAQAQGELPGVSMATQTAPTTPVSSQSLSGNQPGSSGGIAGGTSGNTTGGSIGHSNDGGGEYARGGRMRRRTA